MKLMECPQCRSTELSEGAGVFVCDYCRSQFAVEASEIVAPESFIELDSDIRVLLDKCVADPSNRRRYAGLILDIDPTNTQAIEFLR